MATLFGMFPVLKTLFADSGYQGPKFAKGLAKVLPHLDIEIVKRSDQVSGFVVLPKRWIVERTIAWLNRCRRLAKDWECLNRKALAFLRLASIRLMLRKLCRRYVQQGPIYVIRHPCMGIELSRGRRLLGAALGAEARSGQGWPQATAGGGATAALSATSSAPQWRPRHARGCDDRRDVMRGLGREGQCGKTASPCIRSGARPGTLIFHARVKAKPSKDGTPLREREVCSPG
jgi:transposase